MEDMDETLYSEIKENQENNETQGNSPESKELKTWLAFKLQDGT